MSQMVTIGVIKVGCIGTLPLIEFLLDERAERKDIDVRVVGSGAKLRPEQCKEITSWIIPQKPNLVILIGPAQSTQGPREAREILSKAGIPTIIISDGPTKTIVKELEKADFGYLIINADSMIGARREFLDPTEMALYNSDVIKVLAGTGVFNIVVRELDTVIQSLKNREIPDLPHVIIDKEKAIEAAEFDNPYAKAKAIVAHEMSRHVAELNVEGCFRVKERSKYISLITAGHEMMRMAAKLVDEARELEKSGDSVLRKSHNTDGSLKIKRVLIEKRE